MRVAGYCRVSTEDQAQRGYSLEAQQQAIAAYAAGRGWEVARWYVDAGISAYNDDPQKRPAFAALLADVDLHQWDTAIVLKLDRLARSVRVSAEALDRFRAHGCALISVSEGWDFGSISGQFLFNIMSSLAQMESATIAERTRRGMAMRASKGLWNGTVPWGARLVEGQLGVDPDKAETMAWALETMAQQPFSAVAFAFNRRGELTARGKLWRPFSVEQWLDHADWLLTQPAPWPALVDAARSRRRQPRTRSDRPVHMLTGLLHCACGGTIHTGGTWRRPDGTQAQTLRCQRYTPDRMSGARCPFPRTHRAHYEDLATAYLMALPDLTHEALILGHDDGTLAERRMELLGRRQRLGIGYADGAIPPELYRQRLAALAEEESRLPPPSAQAAAMGGAILLAQRHWHELLPPAQNLFWRSHVDHFVVTGKEMVAVPNATLGAMLEAHRRAEFSAR